VTTNEGVLPRNQRAMAQTNRIVAGPPDRSGISDRESERVARSGFNVKLGHGRE